MINVTFKEIEFEFYNLPDTKEQRDIYYTIELIEWIRIYGWSEKFVKYFSQSYFKYMLQFPNIYFKQTIKDDNRERKNKNNISTEVCYIEGYKVEIEVELVVGG